MEFSKEELKEIAISSYELLVKIPKPEKNNSSGKFEIKSRNKLKTLPEALKENPGDPAASIIHFVKNASYFLPRAERNEKDERGMLTFLDLLLNKVKEIENKEKDTGKALEKIKYLVGYTNWNADAVCTIFTASTNDDEIKRRLQTMLDAELDIVGAKDQVEKIASDIMKWKQASASEHRQHGRW